MRGNINNKQKNDKIILKNNNIKYVIKTYYVGEKSVESIFENLIYELFMKDKNRLDN